VACAALEPGRSGNAFGYQVCQDDYIGCEAPCWVGGAASTRTSAGDRAFLFAFSYPHGYLQGLVADLTEGSLSAVEHAVGGASGGVESTTMQVSVQYTYRSSAILYLYRRPLKPLRGLP